MMSTSVFSTVDEYGFKRASDFDYERYEEFMSSYYKILTERSKKWHRFIKSNKNLKKSPTLKRYVRKGIPSVHRSQIWMVISGAEKLKSRSEANLYQKLLHKDVDPDVIQSIRMDLPRTYPNNIYFANSEGYQQYLYKALFAYAADNRTVGYCQGLNYIAGLLLIVTKDESNTFWLLKALVQSILPDYYVPNMNGLLLDINVFSEIVKMKIPKLHKHMTNINIPWSLLVTKWFICLYAEVLPIETVLRIWDCLFYDRCKILFRVGLVLVMHYQKPLLECDNLVSFTECFKNIPNDMLALNCHEFMQKVNNEYNFVTNKFIHKLRRQLKKSTSAK